MGGLSIWHWLIVLGVVVLVFGTGKLKNLGSDLGSAVKGFKDGMRDATAKTDAPAEGTAPNTANTAGTAQVGHAASSDQKVTIDVEAKTKS